ncbi:hypothetical protein [Cohaesibacter sp. ES.047]|uniref:hypothetical protein n=1 Tax=Cohaesibacter sp. ES.047 TaxID=1798205 RepID=UPI0012FD66D6|nr:hypothetical protein [Cohaesibacter sp. ES.047]
MPTDKEEFLAWFESLGLVIPVSGSKSVASCLEALNALVTGGAVAIQITLHTEISPKALEACREAHLDIVLGAGSVMHQTRYDLAEALWADFTIAPGRCPGLRCLGAFAAPASSPSSVVLLTSYQRHLILTFLSPFSHTY